MSLCDKLVFAREEMAAFKRAVYRDYNSDGNILRVLESAYAQLRDDKKEFAELILWGREKRSEFQCEQRLGSFVKIQPGAVMFFPGNNLPHDKRWRLCGNAFIESNGDSSQVCINIVYSEIQAYLYRKNLGRYFHWQVPLLFSSFTFDYILREEMYENVFDLFADAESG